MEVVSRKLDATQVDQHDIFAKNVAEKLRNLEPQMRIISEKLINDVLFEAQMGSLNRRAYVCVPSFNDNNYLNRVSYNQPNTTQPTYQPSVQIQENNFKSNTETIYPVLHTLGNSEGTSNSLTQYFASYK